MFCAFFLCGSLLAPAKPVITDITVTNSEVTLLFENTDGSNQFTMQKNLGLDAANWANAADATLAALGGNEYSFTVPRTSADKQFYRILASLITGTPLDPDGDGLPSTLENTFTANVNSPDYSNPSKRDTDGDGFTDGQEYALNTKPNDPSDFPKLANLPAIEFVSSTESFVEGSATKYTINLKSDKPFNGPVAYRVNARTDVAQADYSLGGSSGTVSFSGTSGTIDVTFIDDFEIKPTRILFVELSPVGFAAGYRVGGSSNHIVCVCENDCFWSGVINDGLIERNVRLKVLRKTGLPSQVFFVAGNEDGLNDVDGGQSSQSTGVIPSSPIAAWPAGGVIDSASMFSATSPVLPVEVGTYTRFDGTEAKITEASLNRTLTITADANSVNQEVDQTKFFLGRFTEEIRPAVTEKVYLNRTREGTAFFLKELPSPPDIEVVTIPTTGQ